MVRCMLVVMLVATAIVAAQAQDLLVKVDSMRAENAKAHRTDKYQFVSGDPILGEKLIVRRGQNFNLAIRTNNQESDKAELAVEAEFSFQLNQDTLKQYAVFNSVDRKEMNGFAVAVTGHVNTREGTVWHLQVQVPGNAPVGRWQTNFKVEVKDAKGLHQAAAPLDTPLVILFNPWSPADQEAHWKLAAPQQGPWYQMTEADLEEFVLNDNGLVYQATAPRAWRYGQFDPASLVSTLQSLEAQEEYTTADRMSATMTARALTQAGLTVIAGKWSEPYAPHHQPWDWNGSDEILAGYYKDGFRTQKWGQCWVFGGVLTTLARGLGLATRTVTNTASAHDQDKPFNRAIDHFYSEKGKDENLSPDMIWNFHVWNNVWLNRFDLGPANANHIHSGWQAFDATPQESSPRDAEEYRMGPSSIRAVYDKEPLMSKVAPTQAHQDAERFDLTFVIAEVDAMEAHWVRKPQCTSNTLDCFSLKRLDYGVAGAPLLSPYGTKGQDLTGMYHRKFNTPEYIKEQHPWATKMTPTYTYATAAGGLSEIYGADGIAADRQCNLELSHGPHREAINNLRVTVGASVDVYARVICGPAVAASAVDVSLSLTIAGDRPASRINLASLTEAATLIRHGEFATAEVAFALNEETYGPFMANNRRAIKVSGFAAVAATGQSVVDSADIFIDDRRVAVAVSRDDDTATVAFTNPLSTAARNVNVRMSLAAFDRPVTLVFDTLAAGATLTVVVPTGAALGDYDEFVRAVRCEQPFTVKGAEVEAARPYSAPRVSELEGAYQIRVALSSADGRLTSSGHEELTTPAELSAKMATPDRAARPAGNVAVMAFTIASVAGVAVAAVGVAVAVVRKLRQPAVQAGAAPAYNPLI